MCVAAMLEHTHTPSASLADVWRHRRLVVQEPVMLFQGTVTAIVRAAASQSVCEWMCCAVAP
jgi:hypothetical protein